LKKVEKKQKSPPSLGQTLGSGHFEETPLSLGGGLCCKENNEIKKNEMEKQK
jgi:hypothetical protein